MKVTKAKVKDRSLTIGYAESGSLVNAEGEIIESERELTAKCKDLCHQDLLNAFERLIPHAILIADVREAIVIDSHIEQGAKIDNLDLKEFENIEITGFVISGSEDNGSEAAMIVFRKTTGNRVIDITTPAVKFQDNIEYAFAYEFSDVISDCVSEVEQYLNGKVAIKQLELNFDEFDGESKVKEPKEPKKRGRKAKAEAFGLDPEKYDVTVSQESTTEHQEVA